MASRWPRADATWGGKSQFLVIEYNTTRSLNGALKIMMNERGARWRGKGSGGAERQRTNAGGWPCNPKISTNLLLSGVKIIKK